MSEEWEKWITRICEVVPGKDEVPESLRSNEAFMLAAIDQRYWAVEYASDELKNDREFVKKAVSTFGATLEYLPDCWRKDREIVLAACTSIGWALEFASEEFRADPEIVWTAIRKHGNALFSAADIFKSDRDAVLTAVKTCGEVLEVASEALRNDREIVLAAVSEDGTVLKSAPAFWKDREIVLAAVKKSIGAYDLASDELKQDEEILCAYRENLIRLSEDPIYQLLYIRNHSLFIGRTDNNTVVRKPVLQIPSLLIAGNVGSGKSTFLHQIIRQVIRKYPTKYEAELVLLDPKGVEFAKYRGEPHLRLPIVTDKDTAIGILEELTYGSPFASVFVFIDEYAEWALADTRFRNAVTELAKVGKKRNVYLFTATQCVCPDILSKDFLGAFDRIGAFKVLDKAASRRLIGDVGAEQLAPGEMILLDKEKGEKELLKSARSIK